MKIPSRRCWCFIGLLVSGMIVAQPKIDQDPYYWQQHVDYSMEIDMDVENYRYQGRQRLIYTNNSPDIIDRVFYHLYFNAFQPGSEMDARVQSLNDPDPRMVNNIGTKENPVYQSRISLLSPDEIGYISVSSLTQDGVNLDFRVIGTILEVRLDKPITPGEKTTLDMVFNAQVPVQIRRSGRNNKEGIALSMTQWYPKLAEYDADGWHTDPYIQREFYGVWGDFKVAITIDKDYVIGGTGVLQNANEVGHGYETGATSKPPGDKLTWRFLAENVHDFTWAADPDYLHDKIVVPGGPELHFLYQNDNEIIGIWKQFQPMIMKVVRYFNEQIGPYPYGQYSVIQGGDGGMEYGMCTLITGNRSLPSLLGVTIHELAHSWFQFVLATNEAKHAWMDEGFANYIGALALNHLMGVEVPNPAVHSYSGYFNLVKSGKEQPLTTHSDRYATNHAYDSGAYSKGAVFLSQLGYIIGKENLENTLKYYYQKWAFKHPDPSDFIRCAEKVSGLHLDWYLDDWTKTTNTIDYGIAEVVESDGGVSITLERIGLMPMPVDLKIEFVDGSKQLYYIPLRMMRGVKPNDGNRVDLADWAWAYPSYSFTIDRKISEISSIEIDPNGLMADVERSNNRFNPLSTTD